MSKNNLIQIGGELFNSVGDGIIADAAAVKDYTEGKTQATINAEMRASVPQVVSVGSLNAIGSVGNYLVVDGDGNARGYLVCALAGPSNSPFFLQTYIHDGSIYSRSGNALPLTGEWVNPIQESLEKADNSVSFAMFQTLTGAQRNTALANVCNQTADATTGKAGYKVLRPSASFASQVTETNTVYEVGDVFEVDTAFETPVNIVLDFKGNSFNISKLVLKDNVVIKNCNFVITTGSSFSNPSIVIDGNNVCFENCSFSSEVADVYYLFIKEDSVSTKIVDCVFNSSPKIDIYVCGENTIIENCVFNDSNGSTSNAVKLSSEDSADTTSLCSRNTTIRGCSFGAFTDNPIDCFSGANGLVVEDCIFAQNTNPCIEIKNSYSTNAQAGTSYKDVRMCKNIKIDNCVFNSTNKAVVISYTKGGEYSGDVENVRNIIISNCLTKSNTFLGNSDEGINGVVVDNIKYIGTDSLLNLGVYTDVKVTNIYDAKIKVLCYGTNIVENCKLFAIVVDLKSSGVKIQKCESLSTDPLVTISSPNTTIVRECKKTTNGYLLAIRAVGNGNVIAYENYCMNFCNAGYSNSSGKVLFFNNYYTNTNVNGVANLTVNLLNNYKIGTSYKRSGQTSERPLLTADDAGFVFLDKTIGKSVIWDGSAWISDDKEYNAANFSGLGKKYLEKNIINVSGTDKNVLTQAMVNAANTIYHIQYDFDLNGQTITIPAGCMLEFDGGSIKDSAGTGSITLNGTYIKCDEPRIGILDCTILGTYSNPIAYPEWLVNSPSANFAPALNALIASSLNGVEIKFTAANYKVTPVVTLASNISFTSDNGSRVYTDETSLYTAMFYNASGSHCSNITFKGLKFEQTATNYTVLSSSQVSRLIICCFNSDNIRIKGCQFTFNGTNCISVNGTNCINTYIQDNVFVFKRATNPSSYDVSAVYVADHFHIIENNRFNGYTNSSSDRVNGAIESHGICGIVANNTINNAKVCINVVNNITATTTDAIGRNISGNVCSDVDNFVILWPMTDFAALKNIVISDNIVSDIKVSAITSNYATGLKGAVDGLFVHDNTFIGKSNAFDGNEVNPNLIDIFNLVAVKFYTPANVSARIERNVFKDWPCQIVGMGYYNSSAESTTKQQVVFKDNSLINCFNGSISHYYNAYFNLALCNVSKYGYLEFVDNVIDVPETATMPPIFGSFAAECDIVIKGTIFKACRTKMFYINASATTDIDLLKERSAPQIIPEVATNVRFLIGDYAWNRTKTSRCTKAGRNVSVTMSNASANLSYGVTSYQCDNIASLEVDDVFSSTAIGTSSALSSEKIACICNGKIYTNTWRTLGGYFEENVTQYTPTLTFVAAEFGDASVNTGSSGPSSFDKGMMYYSLGGGRPMFKNNSGDWVDVFNHTYASYQGTFANRPNAATFGHFYFTTDADNRRLIVKNSTGADNWVDTDGFNAKYARKGTTAERPTPANNNQDKGLSYFDTTINKPIYWTGTGWVDATGAAV